MNLAGLRNILHFWSPAKPAVPFSVLFKKFKGILERNNRILELMADMGDKLGGEYIFDRQYIYETCGKLNDHVFKLISDLCVLNQRKNTDLFIVFEQIQYAIQEEMAGRRAFPRVKPVILLEEITSDLHDEVGMKYACLGDIHNTLGLPATDGFVITTKTFYDFMEHNGLLKYVDEVLGRWDGEDKNYFREMSQDVQQRILKGKIPRSSLSHINAMLDVIASRHRGRQLRYAVRSSAWGEGGEFSFAGQYESLLNVAANRVAEAYRQVVASAYSSEAWQYRIHRGFQEHEMAMAVGCQLLVDAERSGVIYSYAPVLIDRESMLISAVWGLGTAVVDGTAESDTFCLDRELPYPRIYTEVGHKARKIASSAEGGTEWRDVPEALRDVPCISPDQVDQLARAAMMIERYYRRPQDIEWAFDADGNLFILQTRPIKIRPLGSEALANFGDFDSSRVIFSEKGTVVQGGVGSGKVFVVSKDKDLEDFPQGAILVSKYTSPRYSRVMNKVQGIITDIGSAAGHMAALAREYRVPALVDTDVGTSVLRTGDEITLDAGQRTVYQGMLRGLNQFELTGEEVFEESYEYRLMRRLLRKINPLNLVDPHREDFKPTSCRTYHDITRYIHEKAVEKLIDLSENYQSQHDRPPRPFESDIPLGLMIIDIENGTNASPISSYVTADNIVSVPMKALIQGLCAPGMWATEPVPVDLKSFMSSITRTFSASMASPEALGRNLAVISKEYLNLNLRLGYHFNIVDAYIGDLLNDNYIYFRFLGGVTDLIRRSRRAKFIAEILERFDFRVEVHGDLVVGRLKKISRDRMIGKMKVIGGLIGYSRQLDIQMHSDSRVAHYLDDFMQRIQHITEVEYGNAL
jgi:pyruvate,water dikinase